MTVPRKSQKWFYIARERMDHRYVISPTKLTPTEKALWFTSKSLRHQLPDISSSIMGLRFKEGKQYRARIILEEVK